MTGPAAGRCPPAPARTSRSTCSPTRRRSSPPAGTGRCSSSRRSKFLPVFLVGGWLLLLDPDNRVTSSAGLLVLARRARLLRPAGRRVVDAALHRQHAAGCCSPPGVIARTVTLLPLRRITDLTWKETLLGPGARLRHLPLRVGRPAAGAVGDHLPARRADVLYRQVSGLLFSSDWGGAAAGGDDEGNPEPPPPPPPPPGRRAARHRADPAACPPSE